jgi:hypothetical protein
MRSTRRVVLAAALVAASSLLGSKAVGAPHNPSASMPDSVAWHEAAYAYIRTQTSVHWCNQNGCSFTAGCPSDARIEHFTTGASARMKRAAFAIAADEEAGTALHIALSGAREAFGAAHAGSTEPAAVLTRQWVAFAHAWLTREDASPETTAALAPVAAALVREGMTPEWGYEDTVSLTSAEPKTCTTGRCDCCQTLQCCAADRICDCKKADYQDLTKPCVPPREACSTDEPKPKASALPTLDTRYGF